MIAAVSRRIGCTDGQVYTLATGLVIAVLLAVAGTHKLAADSFQSVAPIYSSNGSAGPSANGAVAPPVVARGGPTAPVAVAALPATGGSGTTTSAPTTSTTSSAPTK